MNNARFLNAAVGDVTLPWRFAAGLLIFLLLALVTLVAGPRIAVANPPSLTCESTPEREAFAIPTPDGETPFDESAYVEIASGKDYARALPHGWQFALLPQAHGWALRIFDREQTEGRVDLSAVTPPHHGPANPRDIEGWHFRNAANTGPNTGEVNAPQALRLFQFSTGLIGTGGLRPPTGSKAQPNGSETPSEGRGWLRILDYSLDGVEPGKRASILSMKFQACLTWPRPTPEETLEWELRREAAQREADARSPRYLPQEREEIGSCGLDSTRYALDARILPRKQSLDIDGDGAADVVYPIRRISDGAAMLALCRAGTWLRLIGPEDPLLANPDIAQVARALERWSVVPSDHGPFGYIDEPPWPEVGGEVLVLERIEKAMAILYWQDGAPRSRSLYRFVEP